MILLQAPWAMRAIFGTPPSGALPSVARSFFRAMCVAVVLAAIDSAVWQAAIFWGPVEFLIAACVPAIACTSIAIRMFGGGIRGFVALLPAVCYFNVLLMSWEGQFVAPVVLS